MDPAASEPLVIEVAGDAKSLFVGVFPYDSPLLPAEPFAQGLVDLRLKLAASWGPLSLDVHHAATAATASPASLLGGTGVGAEAPQLVDLSWQALDGDLSVKGRVDRLVLRAETRGLQVGLGRQPVSFGTGLFFTPLDLVNPFTPAVIDQEYKPGVDALRVDIYPSMTSRVTGVGAWAGEWSAGGTVSAAYGQATVGTTDLGAFAGYVHGDAVVGVSTAGDLGSVGVHADAAVTLPTPESPGASGGSTPLSQGDPYLRATVGGLWRPGAHTTVSGEAYLQSFGTADLFADALNPRYARGELWLYGLGYGAVSVGQEVTPLVTASVAVIAAFDQHPSALVAPSLAWSVAEDADLSVGAFAGLGARPDPVPTSEFGAYPAEIFTRMAAYF